MIVDADVWLYADVDMCCHGGGIAEFHGITQILLTIERNPKRGGTAEFHGVTQIDGY